VNPGDQSIRRRVGRVLVSSALAFGVVAPACGRSVDPNLPVSHCQPGCSSETVCALGYFHATPECPSDPVDCGDVDASVPHCPP
jgi:hypothetical protein